MGLEELLKTLKEKEQKEIDDIWQQAKDEADSLRKQTAEAIIKINEEHAEQLASACQKSVRDIFAESQITARKKKLYAYQDLDGVIRTTAIKLLPKLREQNYEKVFAQLVEELPGCQWEKIITSPSDQDLAAKFFERNIVCADKSISGGLIAFSGNGRTVIDNTFEKRLERKWAHILPEIIRRIEKKHDKGASEKTG